MKPTIVIGGGLAGVTVLHELVRRGESAVLLEAESDVASVTSFGSGGLLTASMSDPWNGPGVGRHLFSSLFNPYAAMKLHPRVIPSLFGWGLQFLRNSTPERHRRATTSNFILGDYSVRQTLELSDEIGAESHDMAQRGTIKLCESEKALEPVRELSAMLAPHGMRYTMLSTDEVIAREPQLEGSRDRIACGIFYPDDAAGDSCLFTRRLAEHTVQLGGLIRTGVRVKKIAVWNGTVGGVETTDGETISSDRVVLATGCLSPRIAQPLGVRLQIAPAKGYAVTLDTSDWNARPEIPIVDDAMHVAIVPLGNRLRLVGTAEFTGFDTTLTRARLDNLHMVFERVYPQLAEQADRSTAEDWTGLRPMSADGVPYIGTAGPKGLWMSTGHGHLGWTLAVGSAKLLVAQMLGDAPPIEATPYRPDRH